MSKLNFEDPNFMLLMFTRNQPKRGSGFYHNWSKLMKKNWMTFRRVAQQSVMRCNTSLDSAGLNFQHGHPLWMCMVEKFVWGLKIIPYLDCQKHVHAGAGIGECPTRSWHMNMNLHHRKVPFEFWNLYLAWTATNMCMGMEKCLLAKWSPLCLLANSRSTSRICQACHFHIANLSNPHSSSSWRCEVHTPIVTLGTLPKLTLAFGLPNVIWATLCLKFKNSVEISRPLLRRIRDCP